MNFELRVLVACPLQRPGIGAADGASLMDARKPKPFTVSTICSTLTLAGSNTTTASFARRLTSARSTPFSPSRAFLTATGQAPHVIPSTARTTVEVAAKAAFAMSARPSRRMRVDSVVLIASLPCRGRCDRRRCS